MTNERIALVLGATGGIGGEVAARLLARGWKVKALHRDPARAAAGSRLEGIDWIAGDAMKAGDVLVASRGASILVHAINPPGYRNWARLVLPMLESTLAAARAGDSRIVLPGNVYNYGPDAFPLVDESALQHPQTNKGRIRKEMERRLRAAAETGVRALIVRAGDFFGPHAAANNWFSQGLVKPGRPLAAVQNPGRRGVGHQWAYLPDVAETMVRLIERESSLPSFASFHMGGHWDEDGTAMVEAIRRVAGGSVRARAFPWWAVALARPVVPLFRELHEMRYLWQTGVRLRNDRLVDALGAEPHTPLDEAVAATLRGLGCLPAVHGDFPMPGSAGR